MPDSKHKKIWREMCHRCHNKDRNDYKYYGARGLTVCEEWRESYNNFLDWSNSNGYIEGLTLERIDNDIGYNPNNCKWIPKYLQPINRRKFSNNKSGYTGISYHRKNNNWVANININKKRTYLGSFSSKQDALQVRNQFIIDNNLPHKVQEFINEDI